MHMCREREWGGDREGERERKKEGEREKERVKSKAQQPSWMLFTFGT